MGEEDEEKEREKGKEKGERKGKHLLSLFLEAFSGKLLQIQFRAEVPDDRHILVTELPYQGAFRDSTLWWLYLELRC